MEKSVEPFERMFGVQVPKLVVLQVLENLSLVDLRSICFIGSPDNFEIFQGR